jgi:hypothetical protein
MFCPFPPFYPFVTGNRLPRLRLRPRTGTDRPGAPQLKAM